MAKKLWFLEKRFGHKKIRPVFLKTGRIFKNYFVFHFLSEMFNKKIPLLSS